MTDPLRYPIEGELLTLREMAERSPVPGISPELIRKRIRDRGMAPEDAMTAPILTNSDRARLNRGKTYWRRWNGGGPGGVRRMKV